jgi:DNA-binding MarR family transcriptional regulator/N-acetylglutamate synthase-like GNAT family acetyltransferase
MNFVQELGIKAFGSRLKNFSDLLIRDVTQIYSEQNIDFEPRWFTLMMLLEREGELSVTGIAQRLNQTHPAVIQVATVLEREGLVNSTKKEQDARKRYLKLSSKGKKLISEIEPLWKSIENATQILLEETDPDFLNALYKIEMHLQKKSLYERIKEQIKKSEYEKISIVAYSPELKKHFKRLNYEWLEKYFEVEEADRIVLENPETEIIDKGGEIFFAMVGEQIAGTVGICKVNNNSCELTKMAVSESFQGKQVGKKLLNAALDYVKSKGYRKIELFTSPILEKAVSLYRAAGFVTSTGKNSSKSGLHRCSIKMVMKIR